MTTTITEDELSRKIRALEEDAAQNPPITLKEGFAEIMLWLFVLAAGYALADALMATDLLPREHGALKQLFPPLACAAFVLLRYKIARQTLALLFPLLLFLSSLLAFHACTSQDWRCTSSEGMFLYASICVPFALYFIYGFFKELKNPPRAPSLQNRNRRNIAITLIILDCCISAIVTLLWFHPVQNNRNLTVPLLCLLFFALFILQREARASAPKLLTLEEDFPQLPESLRDKAERLCELEKANRRNPPLTKRQVLCDGFIFCLPILNVAFLFLRLKGSKNIGQSRRNWSIAQVVGVTLAFVTLYLIMVVYLTF